MKKLWVKVFGISFFSSQTFSSNEGWGEEEEARRKVDIGKQVSEDNWLSEEEGKRKRKPNQLVKEGYSSDLLFILYAKGRTV